MEAILLALLPRRPAVVGLCVVRGSAHAEATNLSILRAVREQKEGATEERRCSTRGMFHLLPLASPKRTISHFGWPVSASDVFGK